MDVRVTFYALFRYIYIQKYISFSLFSDIFLLKQIRKKTYESLDILGFLNLSRQKELGFRNNEKTNVGNSIL